MEFDSIQFHKRCCRECVHPDCGVHHNLRVLPGTDPHDTGQQPDARHHTGKGGNRDAETGHLPADRQQII